MGGGASGSAPPIQFYDSDKGCPFAQRTWVALLEKGLPFVRHEVDLSNKPAEFEALYASIYPVPNAPAKVPILLDEATGACLVESLVCAEYLAAAYPSTGTALLPTGDAAAAARVRLFVEAFSSTFIPALFAILRADTQAGVAAGRQAVAHALAALDGIVRLHGSGAAGSDFFLEDFSLAEVAAVGFVQRALVALPHFRGLDLRALLREQGLTRLERWMDATLARPSAVQTRPADETVKQGWAKHVAPLKA